MARRIHRRTDIASEDLERRSRAAKEPHERRWGQMLWLLARGQKAKDIAESTGYSAYWSGQIAKRYTAEGADGMRNRQYTHSQRAALLVSADQLAALAEAVRGPAPAGDHWLGRTVAEWMRQRLGRPVRVQLGWGYLVRLHGKRRKPRPRHVQADPVAQEAVKKAPSPPKGGGDRLSPGAGGTVGSG